MNKKGFISTAFIISVVILASAIILLMMERKTTNSNFESNIAINIKTKLLQAKSPHCSWGISPYMILGIDGIATSTITLDCFHIDGISNDLINTNYNTITNYYISKYKRDDINGDKVVSNDTELKLTVINVKKIHNGYEVVMELESRTPGMYYLKLNTNSIVTNDNYYNKELISADLNNKTKYINVLQG